MPLKWKLFRVLNFVQMAITAMPLLIMILRIAENGSISIDTYSIIFFAIVATLVALNITNLHFLYRYYPHTLPGRGSIIMANLVFYPAAIVYILLTVLFFAGLFEEMSEYPENDNAGLYMLAYLALVITTGVYNCCTHMLLRRTLRRNFELSLKDFLST